MMNFWLTTDTHFGHIKLVEQNLRPVGFEDKIFKGLINALHEEDVFIHFGDISFDNDAGWHEKIKELPGKKWLIKGNHDKKCVSKATRILTRSGYKYWNEIKEGELIPTVNLETNKVEFNPVLDLYVYKDEPYIYRAKHGSGEMEVTAHHTVLYQSGVSKLTDKWKKNIAENIWGTKNEIVIPCKFSSSGTYACDIKLLKLLAWIMTDGGIYNRTIILYQSKLNYVEEIKELLDSMGIPYVERIKHRKIEYICGRPVKSTLPQHIIRLLKEDSVKILESLGLKDKYHIPEWLYDLSDDNFEIFLNELVKGDGSFREKGHRVIWGNREWLCGIMGLCVTHNIHANILKQSGRNNFYLGIRHSTGHKKYTPKSLSKVPYNDIVWCVNVKNHNFFAELNGKTFVTGNSSSWYISHGWDFVGYSITINHFGYKILMSHIPQPDTGYDINIHGHFHNTDHRKHEPEIAAILTPKHYLLALEYNNYLPWNLSSVVGSFKKRQEKKVEPGSKL